MNVFDAPVERVEQMGVYIPPAKLPDYKRVKPAERKSNAGRPQIAVHHHRRIIVKVYLTEAEYAAVKGLDDKSGIGREALLAAAAKCAPSARRESDAAGFRSNRAPA